MYVCELAAASPSCGTPLLMSHSCLERPRREHYTPSRTSHTSPPGNERFLFSRSPFCFPLKAQRGMSLYCCQTEIFPPRFSESASDVVKKRKGHCSSAELSPWLLRRKPLSPTPQALGIVNSLFTRKYKLCENGPTTCSMSHIFNNSLYFLMSYLLAGLFIATFIIDVNKEN